MNIAINIAQLQHGCVEGVVTCIGKLLTHLPKYSKKDNIYLIKRHDLDIGTISKSINTINIQRPSSGRKIINKAMACGMPVITSNNSSLPEVVGNAGIVVDAHDTEELTDVKLADRMSKKGLARAKKYAWKASAKILKQLINTYK